MICMCLSKSFTMNIIMYTLKIYCEIYSQYYSDVFESFIGNTFDTPPDVMISWVKTCDVRDWLGFGYGFGYGFRQVTEVHRFCMTVLHVMILVDRSCLKLNRVGRKLKDCQTTLIELSWSFRVGEDWDFAAKQKRGKQDELSSKLLGIYQRLAKDYKLVYWALCTCMG